MAQVFDHLEYRIYLKAALDSDPEASRGQRSRLAQALGCQPSYLSQILKGTADLSLEQADRLNKYYGHTDEESEYLLLLVSLARAGTASLREQLDRQARRRQDLHRTLKHRVKSKQKLRPEDQQTFYGSWQYAAVAVALTIPPLRTREALGEKLGIPRKRLAHILDFLLRTGIVVEDEKGLQPGTAWLHLGDNAELAARDHANWRLRAVTALENPRPTDLHYSSVVSVSASDLQKIKTDLIAAIEAARSVIKASPEERLVSLLVDLFEL